MVYNAKSVILAVHASLRWLNNVSESRFPSFLLVCWVWDISSSIGPCFPLTGGLCKFYANVGGKRPIQRQPLLMQYKQQANPLLSTHNYTPLAISRNEKNEQITLLSQRKLALTERNV
jgi:hypothetical protein